MKRRCITIWRIIHTGIVNFIRNFGLSIAAMAVMLVTLTIILFSILANAAFNNTIMQITNKIDVSVFLQDSDTPAQTALLIRQLKALPDVKTVQYLNKAQVFAQYEQQNTGNQLLVTSFDEISNPLPATILITPQNLNYIQNIKDFLTKPSVAALQSDSPTYSGEREVAINRITHATDILREIGIIAIVTFIIISALIIFNTIQMAIFNRRDEITNMRLLGASTSYIRGPFIVESVIYGVLSACISVLIIKVVFQAASNALQSSSLGLLDINYAYTYYDSHFLRLLGFLLAFGILLGAGSSIIATSRYLKFKTK